MTHQPKKTRPRWHLLYYALAALDLLTIGFTLSLNHRIIGIYEASVVHNAAWVRRLSAYDEIARLAGVTNAPGNDVFDSLDVSKEKKRKETALGQFRDKLTEARAELASIGNPQEREALGNELVALERAMNEMSAEADMIFSFIAQGATAKAGTRMATMDRRYADLNDSLARLRTLVRGFQQARYELDQAQAQAHGRTEWLVACFVLLLVSGVVVYGHWLSRKIEASQRLIEDQRESLETSARLAALGVMSAGVAHEINNPLTVIQGYVQMIRMKASRGQLTPQDLDDRLATVLATCARIRAIVTGLRTFARDGRQDSFAKATAAKLIEDALVLCRDRFVSAGVDLRAENLVGEIEVTCREVQMVQVLVNLLSNALDAVAGSPDPWAKLTVEANDAGVRFTVQDSGPGIPPAVAEKLMTPFFTTKEVGKGTGLGLSISHGIVTEHGGKIYLDKQSKNTCFVVEIPSQTSRAEAA